MEHHKHRSQMKKETGPGSPTIKYMLACSLVDETMFSIDKWQTLKSSRGAQFKRYSLLISIYKKKLAAERNTLRWQNSDSNSYARSFAKKTSLLLNLINREIQSENKRHQVYFIFKNLDSWTKENIKFHGLFDNISHI